MEVQHAWMQILGVVPKKSAGRDVASSTRIPAYLRMDDVVRPFTVDYKGSPSSKKVNLLCETSGGNFVK
jgi:hypothetical protein